MSRQFELETPSGLNGVLHLLSQSGGTILAGGSNLMIDLRSGKECPQHIIALDRLQELRGIEIAPASIAVGSRTTVSDLLQSPEIAAAAPSLIDAARLFAGHMVRNTGTIGGNIACASPAADLVPPLMSLDAQVTLSSASGSRTVALSDYYLGYKKDIRSAAELITQVSWMRRPGKVYNRFYKLARRKGDAITVVGVAVTLEMSRGKCTLARIALGSVAPCVIRARKAEAMLEGQVPSAELLDAAARQAVSECSPIDDVRASAEYRRHSVGVITRRLLLEAWNSVANEDRADV